MFTFQGEKGYCYIPYDYMSNSAYAFDAWTIRQLEHDDMGHEYWDNDDSIDFQQNNQDDDDNDDDHEIEIEDDNNSSSSSSSSED